MREAKKKFILIFFFFFCFSTIPFITVCDQSTNNSTAMPIPQLHRRQTGLVDGHGITSAGLNNTDESLISSRVGSNDQSTDHHIRQFGGRKMLREAGNRSTPAASAGAFGFFNSIACFFRTSCDQSTNNSTVMDIPQLHARGTALINGHEITSPGLNNTDERLISSNVDQSRNHPIRQYGDRRLMRELRNSSAENFFTFCDQSTNNSTAMPIPQFHGARQTVLVDGHGISSTGLNNTGETLISSRVGSPNESMDHSGGRKLLWVLTLAVLSPENFGEGSPNRNNMTGSNSQSTDHPIRQHVKRTVRESPSAAAPPPPDLGETAPYWNHEKRGQNKTGE